ncbi:MAG TPA: LLM class F420-dependent oxidoreductase [Candidatus Dormibacteraeota bacterium]|nr:LLM class F420-dependent oxidoreductase [Candidatus Dormibacteraeota bacterium]
MKVGVVFPQTETSSDPAALRAYVEAVESMGFAHVALYDHVLGAQADRPGGWRGPYTDADLFHEVFVTLGYMAAITSRLELVTEVLVLPQRQTALVAKQAAEVDLLSGGRLRLGVGLGWNRVEYEALREEFGTRGRRIEEQVELMRRLWGEPVVDFSGEFHSIPSAGINPLPGRRIPVWMGGTAEAAKRRAARIADGWMMNAPTEEAPRGALLQVRQMVADAGRDPSAFGIEVRVPVTGGLGEAAAEMAGWHQLGISHATVNTMGAGLAWPNGHIDALRRFTEVYSEN